MKKEQNEYTFFDKESFTGIYKQINSRKELMSVLVEMQTREGVTEQKAYDTADALIWETAHREGLKNAVLEDAPAAVGQFLAEFKAKEGVRYPIALHEIRFGLTLYQDEELLRELNEGANFKELFEAYYQAHSKDPDLTEEAMEEDIRQAIAGFHISPRYFRTMEKKLKSSDDLLAASAAMSKEGARFKCIAAMDLYLRGNKNGRTMPLSEAVNVACTHADIEAVADAVHRGEMARDTAAKVLNAIVITGCIAFALYALVYLAVPGIEAAVVDSPILSEAFGKALLDIPQYHKYTLTSGSAFLFRSVSDSFSILLGDMARNLFFLVGGVGLLDTFSDRISGFVGKLAAKRTFLYSDPSSVRGGLGEIADCLETEAQAEPVFSGAEDAAGSVRQADEAHAAETAAF